MHRRFARVAISVGPARSRPVRTPRRVMHTMQAQQQTQHRLER
ncbi:hypothetical protein [Lysobacter gummosus]